MREGEPIGARQGAHPVLWAMAAVMLGFELMFAAAQSGMIPPEFARWPVYLKLAFFDLHLAQGGAGLYREVPVSLHAVRSEAVGPWAVLTVFSYAFLHGGWLHLLLNGAVFLGLGNALVRAIGVARFLVTFFVTAAAGALVFQLLSTLPGPLVGASGSLFGFLGMITAWQELALRRMGLSRAVIWKRIFGLVLLNVILAIGLIGIGGLLAWQAHLGGWIAGWLLAYAFPPRGPAFRIL